MTLLDDKLFYSLLLVYPLHAYSWYRFHLCNLISGKKQTNVIEMSSVDENSQRWEKTVEA